VALVRDAGDDGGHVPTWTGIATGERLAALRAAGEALTDGRGFAVTRDALDVVLGPMVGLSGDELLARGFVFGLVYGGASADGSGEPVVGATVRASSPDFTIVYPGNRFSGTADATTSQGVFLAVPSAAGPATTVSFEVTAPDGDLTWETEASAVNAGGGVYFHLMYPAE
jgi:hypothetical protein